MRCRLFWTPCTPTANPRPFRSLQEHRKRSALSLISQFPVHYPVHGREVRIQCLVGSPNFSPDIQQSYMK